MEPTVVLAIAAVSASVGAAIDVKLLDTYSAVCDLVVTSPQAESKADEAPTGSNGALAKNLRTSRRDNEGSGD